MTDESKVDIMNKCQQRKKSNEKNITHLPKGGQHYQVKVGRERMGGSRAKR